MMRRFVCVAEGKCNGKPGPCSNEHSQPRALQTSTPARKAVLPADADVCVRTIAGGAPPACPTEEMGPTKHRRRGGGRVNTDPILTAYLQSIMDPLYPEFKDRQGCACCTPSKSTPLRCQWQHLHQRGPAARFENEARLTTVSQVGTRLRRYLALDPGAADRT